MNLKIKSSVCQSCNHIGSNVYGQYCTKAQYESGEYGHFFRGNVCIHDELNSLRMSLFEPVTNDAKARLSELQVKFNQLERESSYEIAKLENAMRTILNNKANL